MLLEAFTGNGNVKATRQVYSKESHKDGGHRYHLNLKLGPQDNGYFTCKKLFRQKTYYVKLYFSDKHTNYHDVWK